jgi:hypothetical protein
MTDVSALLDKAGVVVMVLSALASVVNHVVRKQQDAGQTVAGWLYQVNAILNVGALNLDKAVQQFKASKEAGSTFSIVGTLLSLLKGKAPAIEAVLEKAAEVEKKAEGELHAIEVTAGEGIKLVNAPITLVKEDAVEEKVELTVSTPETEEKVAEGDVAASVLAGIADYVHNEEEQLPPPPAEIVVPELAEDTVAYVTEPKKKRTRKTEVVAEKASPKRRKKA